MTFRYRYQDRERGVLENEIAASSESDAYAVLRKSGIRPMKVWAKPGLMNQLSAIGKRGAAIIVLGAICLALAVTVWRGIRGTPQPSRPIDPNVARAIPRKQVGAVEFKFRYGAENVLRHFAQPGDPTLVPEAEQRKGRVTSEVAMILVDLEASLKNEIRIEKGDSPAVIDLKSIVAGLKDEARMLLAAGNDQSAVLGYFMARQKMEVSHRREMLRMARQNPDSLDEINVELRSMGMKEITAEEL